PRRSIFPSDLMDDKRLIGRLGRKHESVGTEPAAEATKAAKRRTKRRAFGWTREVRTEGPDLPQRAVRESIPVLEPMRSSSCGAGRCARSHAPPYPGGL